MCADNKKSDDSSDFINWMLNSVPMEELITAFRQMEKREISCSDNLKGPLAKKLAQNVTSEEVLFELLSGDVGRRLDSSDKSAALAKLTDQSKLISLCCDSHGRFSDEEKTAMLQKVSEDRVCEFIRSDKRLDQIKNEMLLSRVSDNKKLAKALIDREDSEGTLWHLIEALEKRSQTAVASIATLAKNAKVKEWAEGRLKDKKVILQMILSKHVDDAQKIRLADRLEYGDVDEKTYAAATGEDVKKALFRKLSPEGRAALRKADRSSCEKMIEAAKAKSAETFQLGGFYLGMPIDDAERLVGYYQPGFETLVEDSKLLIPRQSEPLCIANKSGKVLRFNFGKSFLKTWYKFDVQNDSEWAAKYAGQNGISMSHDVVMAKRTIRLSDNERLAIGVLGNDEDVALTSESGYFAYVVQGVWRHKANGKGYRIEYFGPRTFSKDSDGGDRLAEALVSKLADEFSDVSAEEGTLRVTVSDD